MLANRITTGGKLNVLDLNIHCESFYLHLFNLLYGYNLDNLNQSFQNAEAIDLIDHSNKIVIQVSSTNSKQKIESTLAKSAIQKYSSYTFKFISIAQDASSLRKKKFENPYSISFDPLTDIYDTMSILKTILNFDINKLHKIYDFIKKELGNEVDTSNLGSNLAAIINILAKEKWDEANKSEPLNSFQIDTKISYNDLNLAKGIIEEYVIYHRRVDATYCEFDILGSNKSNSVLAVMKRTYSKQKNGENSDEIFFSVIEEIKDKILMSPNYIQIPIDELELCVDILVVDAFIRCKIFENPEGYDYVAP
jgi:hypothetical protein